MTLTKELLEALFAEASKKQVELGNQIQRATAQVQQLQGRMNLLNEFHERIVKSETKLEVLPDPPTNEEAAPETPAAE